MTSKQTNTFREEIERILDTINTSYGEDPKYVSKDILALFQKVVDRATGGDQNLEEMPDHPEIYKNRFVTNLSPEEYSKRLNINQIRASFKDIISGKIEL